MIVFLDAKAATDSTQEERGYVLGAYIHLHVSPFIDSDQWAEVWDETLCILENYPIPLMRIAGDDDLGTRRWMLSHQLSAEDPSDGRFWRIDGDFISGRRGETFDLYRHPA